MFRIIKCQKDTYVTDKIIRGTRCTDSNVGEAGTLDLFKLYGETKLANSASYEATELSRILLKFDLQPLIDLTSSYLDISDPSFKCTLKMRNVRGGQPVPSNFTLTLFPLAHEFDEGRGRDVGSFMDVDSANFITASSNPTTSLWFLSGANASGSVGSPSVDYYVSGNLGSGVVPLGVSASFSRGDEDLSLDLTTLVSGTIAGLIPDHGFRLSFSTEQETDQTTRFVKRFASRHVEWFGYRPRIEVGINNAVSDGTTKALFDKECLMTFSNKLNGSPINFLNSGSEVTGSNSLLLTLIASGSITSLTTSWSIQHSASITYPTSSTVCFSQSFSASQYSTGSYFVPGTYQCSFTLSSSNPTISTIIGKKPEIWVQPLWQSLDGNTTYLSGSWFPVHRQGTFQGIRPENVISGISVLNLKPEYKHWEMPRLQLFLQNRIKDKALARLPGVATSLVFDEVHWRLVHSITKEVIVDFDVVSLGTKLNSTYEDGMWFNLNMSDFEPNQVYNLEFAIIHNGQTTVFAEPSWKFKVVS